MHKKWFVLGAVAMSAFPCWALIGGQSSEIFPEVVKLQTNLTVCSGTIIGPRAIVSAAHCASEKTHFMHNGKKYEVKFVASEQHEAKGHDLALAITDRKIEGAIFARIGQGLTHGVRIMMAGFGCTQKGGKPGLLHVAQTRVIGMDDDHVLAAEKDGGVLCKGDSGGPAFIIDGVRRWLVAVSSLSDISRININVRLDSALSAAFLKTAARAHDLEICGLTSECL